MTQILAAAAALAAFAVVGAAAVAVRRRARIWAEVAAPLYRMAGYTELIVDNPIDAARGIAPADSKIGLFKESRDISFYWFEQHGRIASANTFHLNNIGLISQNDYRLDRQPGEYRVVVLGDEMTAATTADVSWPDLLEEFLSADTALLRHLHRTRVSVFNFGWPDAGFAHLAKVWQEKAKTVGPDLVVVNVAEHDFHRYDAGTRLSFRGRPNTEWRHEYVVYRSPAGLKAWLVVICAGAGRDLRSPDCTCARPFALYLSRNLAENPRELAAVQERIVRDFLSGGPEPDGAVGWLSRFRRTERESEQRRLEALVRRREWDVIPGTPLSDAELVANARTRLRTIVDDHPSVVITQNPLLFQVMDQSARFPMTEALMRVDPAIKIVDMRGYLPLGADGDEIHSWYQAPHAPEKWSLKGHRIYARAQAQFIAGVLAPAARVEVAAARTAPAPEESGRRAEQKAVAAAGGMMVSEPRAPMSALLRPMNRSLGAALQWGWRYRRLVWQQMKERIGLARGRARVDDGRDWTSPSTGLMNPVFTVRAVPAMLGWHWRHRRLLWQRLKEKTGVSRGQSRWDDGRDWLTPVSGPMNPVWTLRVVVRRWLAGRLRSRPER